ncbi:hypothetical protein LX36DRAFT_753000 [Colletotrichum falcatum]|nr:hypothetical protein LX36DRAFT_753000 [Colletotrichum falcatum]
MPSSASRPARSSSPVLRLSQLASQAPGCFRRTSTLGLGTGPDVCLYGGEQQFAARQLVFSGCGVGVRVIWDRGWVWKSVNMTDAKTGFKFVPGYPGGSVRSSLITDACFTNVGAVVVIQPPLF